MLSYICHVYWCKEKKTIDNYKEYRESKNDFCVAISKYGLRTSSTSITWRLMRNAGSQAVSMIYRIRKTRGKAQQSVIK